MEPFILPPLEMEMPPALESPSRMMRSSQDKSLRSSQDKSPLSFTGYDGTTDEEEPHSFNSSVASSSDDRLPPVMISRENVITLVDSSGREFHTNLRASDLEYLVKYSIRSNLRRDMRMQKAARTDVFPGRSAYGTNGNGEGHSHYTTQTTSQQLSTNQYGGPAKRTANQVYNNLSSKETFDLLDDPIVQTLDYNSNEYSYETEAVGKRQRSPNKKKMKIEKPSAPYQPAVNPYAKNGGGYGLLAKLQRKRDTNKGRRCRKVYGVEQRDKWCNMCKWKKACDRFADGANDSEIPDSPSPQSAKRANKYRPTVLPKKAAHLPDALELELPPPCDPTQALEALRVSV